MFSELNKRLAREDYAPSSQVEVAYVDFVTAVNDVIARELAAGNSDAAKLLDSIAESAEVEIEGLRQALREHGYPQQHVEDALRQALLESVFFTSGQADR